MRIRILPATRLRFRRNNATLGAETITYNGISFTVSGHAAKGTFVLGDPYVVGTNITISNPNPSWNGMCNGAMVNPANSNTQAFDNQTNIFLDTYDATKQITFPYTMNPGESLILSQSRIPFVPGGAYASLERTMVITCLSSAPAANTFRPSYAGNTKTLFNADNINWSLLPSYANVAGYPIPSILAANNLTNAQSYNYVQVTNDVNDPDNKTQSYDAMRYPWITFGTRVRNATLHANSNMHPYYFPDAINIMAYKTIINHPEREETVRRLVQQGIDWYNVMQFNRDGWCALGGYGKSRKFCILLAGVLLNDSGMKNLPANTTSSVSGATISKFAEDGLTYYSANGSSALYGEDTPAAEGESEPPANTNSGKRDPAGLLDAFYELLPNRGGYNQLNSRAFTGQALAAQNITGMKAAWNYDAFFDYTDRWINVLTPYWGANAGIDGTEFAKDVHGYGGTGSEWCKAIWNAYRDTSAPTLTNPTDTTINDQDAYGTVTTNRPNGKLYWLTSNSSTAPSSTQMKAGQIHVGTTAPAYGSFNIFATGTYTANMTGLTAATTYYNHYYQESSTANGSTIVTANGFTTSASGNPELLPDPGFDSGGAWTQGTGWSVSGSKGVFAGGSSFQLIDSAAITVSALTQYTAKLSVTELTAGTGNIVIRVAELNGAGTQHQINEALAVGLYSFNFTTSSGCTSVYFRVMALDTSQVFKIDNASLKLT
jgi:hypothetical protein